MIRLPLQANYGLTPTGPLFGFPQETINADELELIQETVDGS